MAEGVFFKPELLAGEGMTLGVDVLGVGVPGAAGAPGPPATFRNAIGFGCDGGNVTFGVVAAAEGVGEVIAGVLIGVEAPPDVDKDVVAGVADDEAGMDGEGEAGGEFVDADAPVAST